MKPKFWLHLLAVTFAVLSCCCIFTTTAEPNYFGANHVIPPARSFSSANCYRSVPRCIPFKAASTSFQCLDVILPYKQTFPPVSISSSPPHQQHHSTSFSNTSNTTGKSEDLSNSPADFDSTIKAINEYLARWNGLRAIPQCWKALQYVLCSSFFPKCEDDGSPAKISLPTYDMCRAVRSPCRLVDQYFAWPDWLQCDNQSLFSQKSFHCFNEYKEMKLSSTTDFQRCQSPLVSTDDKSIWYPGIDGCAMRCDHNPLYSEDDYKLVGTIITVSSIFAGLLTFAGVMTFYIDQRRSTRYPSTCIFYVNLCVLLSYLSWMIQQLHRKTEFTCRHDNTVRHGKGNATCIVSFAFIYYFSLAALHWQVIFAYGCTVVYRPKTTSSRKPSEKLYEKKSIFHFVAWFLPFILTLIIIWLEEIDGDSLFGICFVGFAKPKYFVAFVLFPVTLNLLLFIVFMTKALVGLWTCVNIGKVKVADEKQTKKKSKIHSFMLRIFISIVWALFIYIIFVSVYFYQQSLTDGYNQKLHQHIICNFNISDALEAKHNELKSAMPATSSNEVRIQEISESTDHLDDFNTFHQSNNHCEKLKPTPVLWPMILQILCNFSTCILAFLWLFTESTLKSWKKFIQKKLTSEYYQKTKERMSKRINNTLEEDEGQRVSHHHHQTNNNDCGNKRRKIYTGVFPNLMSHSVSFSSYHFDPVGMEFSCNSHYLSNSTYNEKMYTLCKIAAGANGKHSRLGVLPPVASNHSLSASTMANNTTINEQSICSDLGGSSSNAHSLSHSLDSASLAGGKLGARRKSKTKKRFNRLLRRRGSDTTSESIAASAAFIASAHNRPRPKSRPFELAQLQQQQQHQSFLSSSDTKATSPNDLLAAANALLQSIGSPAMIPPIFPVCLPQIPLTYGDASSAKQQQTNNQTSQQFSHNLNGFQLRGHAPMNMSGAVRPPGLYQAPGAHTAPVFPYPGTVGHNHGLQPAFQAIVPPPAIRRPCAIRQTSFTFTHGYNSQGPSTGVQIVNPMEEKRRPDSRNASGANNNNATSSHISQLNNNCIVKKAADNFNLTSSEGFAMPNFSSSTLPQGAMLDSQQQQQQQQIQVLMLQQLMQQIQQTMQQPYNPMQLVPGAPLVTGEPNPQTLSYLPWMSSTNRHYDTKAVSKYVEQFEQELMNAAEYQKLASEREKFSSLVTNRGDSRSSIDHCLPIICTSGSELSLASAMSRMSGNTESAIKQVATRNREEVEQRLQQMLSTPNENFEEVQNTTITTDKPEKGKKTEKKKRKADKLAKKLKKSDKKDSNK